MNLRLPYACQSEAFAQSLHDTEVSIMLNQGYRRCTFASKVDVCLVYNDDTFESLVVQQ